MHPRFSSLVRVACPAVCLLLLAALPCRGQASVPAANPPLDAMHRKLATLVVPNVEFNHTTLSEAVDFLTQEAHRVDPKPEGGPTGRGVNIVVIQPPGSAPAAGGHKRITLALKNVPLLDALRDSAALADMTVSVQPYDVRIIPADPQAFGDMITLVQRAPDGPETAAVQQRLEVTIVPNAELRSTPLSDVLGYLNKLPADAGGSGVNLAFSPVNPPGANDRRVTMTVERVPLLELLRLICLQGDMKLQITPQGAVLVATPK